MHIDIRNLTKKYERSVAQQARAVAAEALGSGHRYDDTAVTALDDVSLRIEDGERIGIIGANGAGKSTLLHVIAGMTAATSGSVTVDGNVTAIMTLGIGIRDDLSGRENILIDAGAQGKTAAEAAKYVDEVIAFAELGEFIDQPVKTYSSGMKARLAFAMIVSIDPEILIIDEALSAGDMAFAAKASARIRSLAKRGGITLVVSHSMEAIRDLCNRCIWIDRGRVLMDGPSGPVTAEYGNWMRRRDEERIRSELRLPPPVSNDPRYRIAELGLMDATGTDAVLHLAGDTATIRIAIEADAPLAQPDLRVILRHSEGMVLIDSRAAEDGCALGPIDRQAVVEVPFDALDLGCGFYELEAVLLDQARPEPLCSRTTMFKIDDPNSAYGLPRLNARAQWKAQALTSGETP